MTSGFGMLWRMELAVAVSRETVLGFTETSQCELSW